VRAVVTGGAGFIGSHLVDALLAAGDEVTVIDHLRRPGKRPLPAAVTLVREDVTDLAGVAAALDGARPEVVYHLAAQIDVRRSVAEPSLDAHVNVGGTAAVLTAALEAGAERVVLASTAGVYGDPRTLPAPEHERLAPLSPYGASKAAAESYLELFSRLHGLSTVSLRMANVYGPRQDPHGEAGVVAIFCAAAAEGGPVHIFGDGTQTRDFVYVGDAVEAFVAAGRSRVEGALNVSTGRETSLTELVAALGIETVRGPARPGEISRSCLDPSAARELLGWTARTPLTDGLARTLEWLAALAAPTP
jgi:UDP-glucose 4-epimerase